VNYFIECAETEHCFYQEFKGRNKDTFCRILNTQTGKAPYKPGKCAFFKRTEHSKSGDYGKGAV
jgi:hypothetical protein